MRSQQKRSGPWNRSGLSRSVRDEVSHSKTPGRSYCSHLELSAIRQDQKKKKLANTEDKKEEKQMWEEKHTTFGLKGGSTSLLSRAGQLTVLKNWWPRILPTIPKRRDGSRSNSCVQA